MWKFFTLLTDYLLKGSVRSALAGAGLGLGSSVITLSVVQEYINNLVSISNSMASDALSLLALSGAHIALSMIIGAIVYRITANTVKVTLMKKQ